VSVGTDLWWRTEAQTPYATCLSVPRIPARFAPKVDKINIRFIKITDLRQMGRLWIAVRTVKSGNILKDHTALIGLQYVSKAKSPRSESSAHVQGVVEAGMVPWRVHE
jgi:hypothetical protein